MAEIMYVRLKPHNPKRGYKLKRYTVFGIRFQGDRGWYMVDPAVADFLKTVHQNNNDPDSPPAFDVCTKQEALKIAEKEQMERLRKGEVIGRIPVVFDRTDATMRKKARVASERAEAKLAGHLAPPIDPGMIVTDDTGELVNEEQADADDGLPADDELPISDDDLTEIDGVGPATAAKLSDAGYSSFASLASARVAEIEEVIGNIAKAKAIKSQAKKLK